MRVLLTGGAGYIGSHTAKALHLQGFEPVAFDNLSTGHRWAVKWGPLVVGDLSDASLLTELVIQSRIDAVVHFAANAYVGESVQNPRQYFHNNVINSLNLLDVLIKTGVKRIVFSSSCATYGMPDELPISEVHPQRPVSPYGESKLFIERALHWYEHAYGLRWVALRYFNAAGADPEGELGEDHDPEPHLIPRAIQCALGRTARIDICGTDYPTPDGTAVRDYIHVTDLATAHVQALKYLLDAAPSAAFNLGTGQGFSVREVIAAVDRVCGRPVAFRESARRPGDAPSLIANADKAISIVGWQPKYSDLTTIIKTAVKWHSNGKP
jgi:UDP-glucose-4-epimerase GalE